MGFEAIQLSDLQAKNAFGHGPKRQHDEWTLQQLVNANKLTENLAQPTLPGSAIEQKALGYLHANCGNCHNPLGHAADNEAGHLKLRHQLAFNTLETTDVYRSAVNQPTKNFTATPYIVMGARDEELALYQSAAFLRMNSVDEQYRMPMIAREKVDYMGLDLIHQSLMTLATPVDFTFDKGGKGPQSSTSSAEQSNVNHRDNTSAALEMPASSVTGLQLKMQFFDRKNVPPVYVLYWPEDDGLKASPVMDHQAGYFTEKLLLGDQGSTMSLKNGDDVGHTIYVKDKKQGVKWQLSYMPPGSSFEQKLDWQQDVFVEMKCRLHLYMSAWVGSINTRYHKIVEPNIVEGNVDGIGADQLESYVQMTEFPQHFTELKIWLPKFDAISTNIKVGETQLHDLVKGNKVVGRVLLQRR
ncbi:MAG: hypothetical protein ACI8WB_002186 [Phenylobacterium sp.]